MDTSSPVRSNGSPVVDLLSPRSKVAKMLADIDDAPTPSPPQLAGRRDPFGANDLVSNVLEEPDSLGQSLPGSPSEKAPAHVLSDSDESDEDVRKPQGRAARRMLGVQGASKPPFEHQPIENQARDDDDEEDLYSSTPVKRTERLQSESPPLNEHGNGLFVSPTKSNEDSDEDLPANPFGSKEKLADLVAQKRAERLAREAEEKERRDHSLSAFQDDDDLENNEPADPEIDKIMSDASRPARKASKKALMEMERETQRLARQQALAHQMMVKKKFTTSHLLAKFNFRRPETADSRTVDQPEQGDTTSSSVPNSDGIEERTKDMHSTPPSTPPTPLDRQKELADKGALSKLVPVRQDSLASLAEDEEDEDLPDIGEVLRRSQIAKEASTEVAPEAQVDKKGLKLARLGKKATVSKANDSDEELEIIQSLPARLSVFDRAMGSARASRPAHSKAIHNLKHLSHLVANDSHPHKKGALPSLDPKTLESQLRRRAKEQAREQQLERIAELRAKGIEVQTVEEREMEAEAFENLLEKARQDAVDLRKAEKAARKEAGDEGAMQVSDDEDEDGDYLGSGREDEDVEDGDDEQEEEGNELLDDVAGETEDDGENEENDAEDLDAEVEAEDAEQEVPKEVHDQVVEDRSTVSERLEDDAEKARRKLRKSRVIVDDEDETDSEHEDVTENVDVDEDIDTGDPFAAFNFGAANNIPLLSPTQAFNATMHTPTQATQEDSFDVLRRIAPPSASSLPQTLPDLDTQFDEGTQPSVISGSQVAESQRIDLNWETQAPETPMPTTLKKGPSALTETPGWEPTQDPGLPSPWGLALEAREVTPNSVAEYETQSTVALRVSESPAASQTAPKRGRFGHRRVPLIDDSDEDVSTAVASVKADNKDAFREMARRRKEALTDAERADAEKEMRAMMDEQAEESEDEYAGLGGDDFVAPETEQDREMIDSSHVDVNERALAAHFAERQRQRDEAETSRLYKDLTTGVLRRKMGANAFDLDEDEDEVAARRRQMRQLEEARKRKALLKDENIATLAEGKQSKGKDAFLKAIADDDGDDDLVNISDEEDAVPATQEESTQSQSQLPATGPLQETSGNKRRLLDVGDNVNDRPPAKQRRTEVSAFKRPTSLLEVKESVSFLLDEPDAGLTFGPSALELSSDSENEQLDQDQDSESGEDDEEAAEEARANDGGFAPNPMSMEAKSMPPPRLPASQRRTASKPSIVDRLSLKRGSSSTESAHGRTAWAAGPTTGGFKVPSLLRRATTNTASIASERGSTAQTLSRENSGVRMGGSKKSSLAYQARAEERKAIVEASAKRRQENTAKIAQLRRNSSALNKGLTGRFE